MDFRWIASLLGVILVTTTAPQVEALVSGGGSPKSTCYVEYDGIVPTGIRAGRPVVECKDGDPCDADGEVNQTCQFNIDVCAFETDANLPNCTPQPVTKYIVPKRFRSMVNLPPLGASTATCATTPSQIPLPLGGKGRKKGTKQSQLAFKLVSIAANKPKKDSDVIILRCLPSTPMPECPMNAAGGPKEIELTTGTSNTDLDNGTTGISHNFPIVSGGQLRVCLSGCDASSNPVCTGSGPTGKGSVNGETFGPPLPLFAANVPVCVINNFADPTVQGTINLQTGAFDGASTPVHLSSRVYLTDPFQVCPRCLNGICNSGAKEGQPCHVDGSVVVNNPPQARNVTYPLSRDCPPSESFFQAALSITLPLTTGTSTLDGPKPCPGQGKDDDCASGQVCTVDCSGTPDQKGGINQFCCTGPSKTPCFPTSAAAKTSNPDLGKIVRTGTPAPALPMWPDPTYPKSTTDGRLAATFCEAQTGSPNIDGTTGLPGPGALILAGKQCVIGNDGKRCP